MNYILILSIAFGLLFVVGIYKAFFPGRDHFTIPVITIATFFICFLSIIFILNKLNIETQHFLEEPYLDENYDVADSVISIFGWYAIFFSGMLSWRINMILKKKYFDTDEFDWNTRVEWNYIFIATTIAVILIYPLTISKLDIFLERIYEFIIIYAVYKFFYGRYKRIIKSREMKF